MSKFPHSQLHIGTLADGCVVRDKAKGKSHLKDHPEVAGHLAPLLKEISLDDFDERNSCVRVFEIESTSFQTDVVEVEPGAQCEYAFRPGRGLGRFGQENFSPRPSRFSPTAKAARTNKLKVVLWRKAADDEEDEVVVVTTCFPGDAEPEPWSYGLSEAAYQRAKAYWEQHAFCARSAEGLDRCQDGQAYWKHNPAS